eukprot:GHVN01010686.1.p1 GENE.GHVN01010686.1~~GHVN01010686.1.p1  ORF type:complete len:117 (+),score=39.61 GHVN01010686.1:116-466(+)
MKGAGWEKALLGAMPERKQQMIGRRGKRRQQIRQRQQADGITRDPFKAAKESHWCGGRGKPSEVIGVSEEGKGIGEGEVNGVSLVAGSQQISSSEQEDAFENCAEIVSLLMGEEPG